eukprot:gene37020-44921_t
MSRGGRGRGRFSRGSAAQSLLRDNLEDLGMDVALQSQDDRQPPALFPPTAQAPPSLPPSTAAQGAMTQLLIRQRLADSFLCRGSANSSLRLELFAEKLWGAPPLLAPPPLELLSANAQARNNARKAHDAILARLEQAEGSAQQGDGDKDDADREDGEEDVDAEAEEVAGEGELEDDYGVDHYASDNERDDDHDGDFEATF